MKKPTQPCPPIRRFRDRLAATLDDGFGVKADTEVSFVRFVPLVGG
jgi:hypothetical protein